MLGVIFFKRLLTIDRLDELLDIPQNCRPVIPNPGFRDTSLACNRAYIIMTATLIVGNGGINFYS